MSYLQDSAGQKRAREQPQPRFRVKAQQWISAVDKMLQVAGLKGLQHFEPPQPTAGPAQHRPLLTVHVDQGSDGWSACHYLAFKLGLRMMICFDPSHRAWNDARQALKDADLWGVVLLLTLVFNVDGGPWKEARWYHTCKEAVATYTQITTADQCPLFQHYLEPMLLDNGWDEHLGNAEMGRTVFQSLPEIFQRQSSRVSLTRWFQFLDSCSQHLKVWHQRLVVQVFLGLDLGLKLQGASMTWKPGAENEQVPTAREGEQLRRLRQSCKNSLELSTVVLGDELLRKQAAMIVFLLGPLRAWHSEQSRTLRSASEVKDWYCCAASGSGFASILEVAKRCHSTTGWRDVFLRGVPMGKRCAGNIDDNFVIESDILASKAGRLCCAILSRRLWTNFWHTRGLPGLLAGLLVPEEKAKTVAYLQTVWKGWQFVQNCKGSFFKQLIERSPFQLTFVSEVAWLHGREAKSSARNCLLLCFYALACEIPIPNHVMTWYQV